MFQSIDKIERISNETRNIINQFFIENWFSTDYCLTKLYPNAMDEVRKVKPSVPKLGDNDIPLRDEIELEKLL